MRVENTDVRWTGAPVHPGPKVNHYHRTVCMSHDLANYIVVVLKNVTVVLQWKLSVISAYTGT